MKKFLAICAVLLMVMGAATVFGQAAAPSDATGNWSGQMQGPNGDMTITFHLKQDGAKLTGSVETGMGDPVDIQNGKVDGNKIYWETSFNGMTIQHDGTVSGDEIKINVKSTDGQIPSTDMTLKRAKA
jgi:hypothetical protein